MQNQNRLHILSLSCSVIILFLLFSNSFSIFNVKEYEAFGHSFTSDDSVTFLTLAKQAAIELDLAKQNFPLNITLAMDHSDNAAMLVNDVFYIDDDIVNDNEFTERYTKEISSKNSTIHSLVAADLIDQILREYASAIVFSVDLTNMSNLSILEKFKKSINSNVPINSSSPDYINYQKLISGNNLIYNKGDYETALALTLEVKDILRDLKSVDAIVTNSNSNSMLLERVEKYMDNFYNILLNRGPPGDLMKLVHLNIHPALQEAFNLKSKMNMDMNM